jgi:hypothetical protein
MKFSRSKQLDMIWQALWNKVKKIGSNTSSDPLPHLSLFPRINKLKDMTGKSVSTTMTFLIGKDNNTLLCFSLMELQQVIQGW